VAGGPLSQIFLSIVLGPLLSKFGSKQIGFQGIATTPQEDLLVLKAFMEAGQIVPVIDRRYPLSQTAEALRYVIDEHARGKVVITMTPTPGGE
jgi:NADPH:quinone reductase-like Zn-dependent oxidoreductase